MTRNYPSPVFEEITPENCADFENETFELFGHTFTIELVRAESPWYWVVYSWYRDADGVPLNAIFHIPSTNPLEV